MQISLDYSAPNASLPATALPQGQTWRRFPGLDFLLPNGLVRWAFYVSLFAIPFYSFYVPGTAERVGVQRGIQVLLFAAIFSRPRVCLRFIPWSLIWFFAYCMLRLVSGWWLAPEYSKMWWPSTLELLQYALPWALLLFNVMRYPGFQHGGLWALAGGASFCALFHIVGIGTLEVGGGVDGRSTIFGLNANQAGETYAVAFVGLTALGLFRDTKPVLRLLVFPMAALLAIGIAKTGSRTGALFAALGVLVLLPQTRAFVSRTRRYLMLLLVSVVFAWVTYQIPTVVMRIAPLNFSAASQEEARGRMVPVLWEMFLRHPLRGSGPDQYQYELTRRALPYMAEQQRTVSAHNLALLLLVETGVMGFLLFGIGLSQALRSAWRARLGSCGLLPLAWLLPMTLAGLTISSPIFETIFWMAIAYAWAGPVPPERETRTEYLSRGHQRLNVPE
jgi:O-antigen ligase